MKNLITLEQVNKMIGEDVTRYIEAAKNSGNKIQFKDYKFWLLGEFDERKKVCYGNVYLYTPTREVYVINGTYTRFYVDNQKGILQSVKKVWKQLQNNKSLKEEAVTKIA